jgi:hypothetical protein
MKRKDGTSEQERINEERKSGAQPGAAADVARRGEKLLNAFLCLSVKCFQEEVGPRG